MPETPHLPDANAIYRPVGRPLRMALSRDQSVLDDVVGIRGYARHSNRSPNGQYLFTVDGYCASDKTHTYWIYKTNLQFL